VGYTPVFHTNLYLDLNNKHSKHKKKIYPFKTNKKTKKMLMYKYNEKQIIQNNADKHSITQSLNQMTAMTISLILVMEIVASDHHHLQSHYVFYF